MIITCRLCKKRKKFKARGMCKTCYARVRMAEWRQKNPKKNQMFAKRYYKNNKKKILKQVSDYRKKRYHNDAKYRAKILLTNRLWHLKQKRLKK